MPPGSPKILIHTRQGRCVGIYCDQPAKVLVVETRDDPRRTVDPSCQAMAAMISPQTSIKLVGRFRPGPARAANYAFRVGTTVFRPCTGAELMPTDRVPARSPPATPRGDIPRAADGSSNG